VHNNFIRKKNMMKKALTLTMLSALLLTNTNTVTTLPTLTQIGSTLAPAIPALWPSAATMLSCAAFAYSKTTIDVIQEDYDQISQEFDTKKALLHNHFDKQIHPCTNRGANIKTIYLDEADERDNHNNAARVSDQFYESRHTTPGLFTEKYVLARQRHTDNEISFVTKSNENLQKYKSSYQSLKKSYLAKTHKRESINSACDITKKLAYVPAALTLATHALTFFLPASQKYSPKLYKLASIAAGASFLASTCVYGYAHRQNKAAEKISWDAAAVDENPSTSATSDPLATFKDVITKNAMKEWNWATANDIPQDFIDYLNQTSKEELERLARSIEAHNASETIDTFTSTTNPAARSDRR